MFESRHFLCYGPLYAPIERVHVSVQSPMYMRGRGLVFGGVALIYIVTSFSISSNL